jgi:aspartate racemase
MSNYGLDHVATAGVLEKELTELLRLNPGCIMICCNSLHKYYDMIKNKMNISIPFFHAVELVAQEVLKSNYRKVLLLATRFTMEDGFFASILEKRGITVVIPNEHERLEMQRIHGELMKNSVTQKSRDYFAQVINNYKEVDAVVLGCTEYPLVVDATNSVLPIIDPVNLQVAHAVDYALKA